MFGVLLLTIGEDSSLLSWNRQRMRGCWALGESHLWKSRLAHDPGTQVPKVNRGPSFHCVTYSDPNSWIPGIWSECIGRWHPPIVGCIWHLITILRFRWNRRSRLHSNVVSFSTFLEMRSITIQANEINLKNYLRRYASGGCVRLSCWSRHAWCTLFGVFSTGYAHQEGQVRVLLGKYRRGRISGKKAKFWVFIT